MNIKKPPTEEDLSHILELREESPEQAGQQSKLSNLEQHHPRLGIMLRYLSCLFIITLIYFSLLSGFYFRACDAHGIGWGIFVGLIMLDSPISLIIIFLPLITLFFPKFNISLIWRYGIIFSAIGFIISFCIAFIFDCQESCHLKLW